MSAAAACDAAADDADKRHGTRQRRYAISLFA